MVSAPRFAAVSATSPTLRVEVLPIEADAQPYYAERLDLFKKAGLDVPVTSITNGAAILSAVFGGSMEIAASNIISLASAHKRGINVAASPGRHFTRVSLRLRSSWWPRTLPLREGVTWPARRSP